MIQRGRASTERLAARVEVLTRGCLGAGLPIGIEGEPQYHFPLSPRAQQTVDYLVAGLPRNQELARRVQGAVLQFQGALRVMDVAELKLLNRMLQDEHVEALRNALFFLSRFGEQFRQDPMLSVMFPPPQTVGGTPAPTRQTLTPLPRPLPPPPTRPGHHPAAATEAPQQPAPPQSPSGPLPRSLTPPPRAGMPPSPAAAMGGAQDPLAGKADRLLAYLQPKMETVRLVNALLDPTQVGKAGDLMSPAARTARTLGATIKKQNRALMTTLQEAFGLYQQLLREQRHLQAGVISEPAKQGYFKLRVHTMNFLKEPLLREVFPPGDKAKLGDV